MWSVISGILQILFLLLKNKFEKDAEEKKRKEALHEEATTAIKSGDIGAINNFIVKLRQQ